MAPVKHYPRYAPLILQCRRKLYTRTHTRNIKIHTGSRFMVECPITMSKGLDSLAGMAC